MLPLRMKQANAADKVPTDPTPRARPGLTCPVCAQPATTAQGVAQDAMLVEKYVETAAVARLADIG